MIVGGGFGGVGAARELGRRVGRGLDAHVTLISDSNFLLFRPALFPGGTRSSARAEELLAHPSRQVPTACLRPINHRQQRRDPALQTQPQSTYAHVRS
ncbi:hypothetical protein [Streptomyces sp. NRAIS3]